MNGFAIGNALPAAGLNTDAGKVTAADRDIVQQAAVHQRLHLFGQLCLRLFLR